MRTTGYVNTHVPHLTPPPSKLLDSPPVRIDLIVLCDLVERLSGLFIMAERANSGSDVLHNITMPRSWFINLNLPDADLEKDTSTFLTFAGTIIEIMQEINEQVQSEGLFFFADGSRITDMTGPLYIARM